jgi:hypothetical protein
MTTPDISPSGQRAQSVWRHMLPSGTERQVPMGMTLEAGYARKRLVAS